MIAIHNVVAASATVGAGGARADPVCTIPTIYRMRLFAGILAMPSMHGWNFGRPLLGVKLP